MTTNIIPFDAAEYLTTIDDHLELLSEALAEGDAAYIEAARDVIARSRSGVPRIAEEPDRNGKQMTDTRKFFMNRLRNLITVNPSLANAIKHLPMTVEEVASNQRIAAFGEGFDGLYVILSGWAMRYVLTGRDRRRITAFIAPGDFFGINADCQAVFDHAVLAVGHCMVGRVASGDLADLVSRFPEMLTAMARSQYIELTTMRRWMTATDDARTGLAHLLSEIMYRLNANGIPTRNGVVIPMTQEHLAQSLDLTSVHLCRVFAQLRADNLIQTRRRYFKVTDEAALHEAGRFDSRYLRPWANSDKAGAVSGS